MIFPEFFDPRWHILQNRAGQVVDLAEISILVPLLFQKVLKSASKLVVLIFLTFCLTLCLMIFHIFRFVRVEFEWILTLSNFSLATLA